MSQAHNAYQVREYSEDQEEPQSEFTEELENI